MAGDDKDALRHRASQFERKVKTRQRTPFPPHRTDDGIRKFGKRRRECDAGDRHSGLDRLLRWRH